MFTPLCYAVIDDNWLSPNNRKGGKNGKVADACMRGRCMHERQVHACHID